MVLCVYLIFRFYEITFYLFQLTITFLLALIYFLSASVSTSR